MPFSNEKKTFLAKIDKSKKGSIDQRMQPLLAAINAHPSYYTTSSCSGRVYFWQGSGKKNETVWLRVSHDLITPDFFQIPPSNDSHLIWLRYEPFIMHVACIDLTAANDFLTTARALFKKSSILSATPKIIVEIRGSDFIEMPFWQEGKILYNGDLTFLQKIINEKLKKNWQKINQLLLTQDQYSKR